MSVSQTKVTFGNKTDLLPRGTVAVSAGYCNGGEGVGRGVGCSPMDRRVQELQRSVSLQGRLCTLRGGRRREGNGREGVASCKNKEQRLCAAGIGFGKMNPSLSVLWNKNPPLSSHPRFRP